MNYTEAVTKGETDAVYVAFMPGREVQVGDVFHDNNTVVTGLRVANGGNTFFLIVDNGDFDNDSSYETFIDTRLTFRVWRPANNA